ncbi:amidase [Mycobacterium angelicum]|uniref:Amidase n=1 Tax=Mycobacterium angelicum TaxID=470074 RepID=A0A1X0A399_MYCAN|nr:amidase [Mycobacterium angelicum]MCV7197236.1 amidase [Mycobacterium angelicum]ORA24325.1 amidase [Mycobacterium angelicum]
MAVVRPSAEDIDSAAEYFGFDLDAGARTEFLAGVKYTLQSYDVVDELYDDFGPPRAVRRSYRFPQPGYDPLNAWCVTSEIRSVTEGLLSGRRVAIKDNIAVAGIPMMNGSKALAGFVPNRDATVVERILASGATIAGKSVCENFCGSTSSSSSASGPVRNPWDRTRETGGSSSGSAALVASGAVELALGSDQGGSIRLPASLCGIVGLKPTHGLVPYTGAVPIESTIDHLGPMTRTVADAALALTVLAGTDGKDPRQPNQIGVVDYQSALDSGAAGLRVGILAEGFGQPDSRPEVDAQIRSAALRLSETGCTVGEISVPWHRKALHIFAVIFTDCFYQMLNGSSHWFGTDHGDDPELLGHLVSQRRARSEQLSAMIKMTVLCGHYSTKTFGGTSCAKARSLLPHIRAAYDEALRQYDVLVLPTIGRTARTLSAESISDISLNTVANTAPLNLTGHPAISVPAGLMDGLPTGMTIIGRQFDDATVLRVADAFESHCNGFPSPLNMSCAPPKPQ